MQPTKRSEQHHGYQLMYGIFLRPQYDAVVSMPGRVYKMLEIGLGCDMDYGPEASIKIWRSFFGPSAQIWEAEYDAACVKRHQKRLRHFYSQIRSGNEVV